MWRWRAAAPTEPVRATASRVSRAGKSAASIMKRILPFGAERFTGLHDLPGAAWSRRAAASVASAAVTRATQRLVRTHRPHGESILRNAQHSADGVVSRLTRRSVMARTLLDKVWEAHTVRTLPSGQTQLLIGLHLIHEVTTPQAFQMLKESKLKVRMPERTFGTLDHIIPTTDQTRPYADPLAEEMAVHMYRNMKEFGLPLFDMSTRQAGHRPRDRARAGPQPAGHDHRLRRQPHLDPRRRRRHRLRHRHHAGARRAGHAVPRHGQAQAAPGARGGRARQGRLRQGRDPRHHRHARREGRRGLRLRVRRRRHRAHDDGRAPHRLQHVHRGRRALRLRQSRRDDHRVPPRPALRARGARPSTARPRGGGRWRPSPAPRSTTSRASTARPSSRW